MRRRPAVTLFAAALLVASCSPAFAQLGGLMKKVPKVPAPPSVPSPVSSPAPSQAEDQALLTSCEQLKQFIDALKAERQALEQGAREASAAKARLEAEKAGGSDAHQERMMGALEASAAKEQRYKDCLDAAMLKDPDNPKLERLEMQAEDELDDAKADKLTEQADASVAHRENLGQLHAQRLQNFSQLQRLADDNSNTVDGSQGFGARLQLLLRQAQQLLRRGLCLPGSRSLGQAGGVQQVCHARLRAGSTW